MENKNNMVLLAVLAFSSFVFLNPTEAQSPANPQLKTVCGKTQYPELCVATLGAHLDDKASLDDPKAVFQTSLKAAEAEATSALGQFDKLISVEKDDFDRGCLTSCKNFYNDVIESIQKVKMEKEYNNVMNLLSTAVTYITTCGDDFGEERINKASTINTRAANVMGNSITFAGLVKQWA